MISATSLIPRALTAPSFNQNPQIFLGPRAQMTYDWPRAIGSFGEPLRGPRERNRPIQHEDRGLWEAGIHHVREVRDVEVKLREPLKVRRAEANFDVTIACFPHDRTDKCWPGFGTGPRWHFDKGKPAPNNVERYDRISNSRIVKSPGWLR